MTTATPAYLEAKLERSLERLHELARLRGVEQAFEFVLWDADYTVRKALEAGSTALAQRALQELRELTIDVIRAPGGSERGVVVAR